MSFDISGLVIVLRPMSCYICWQYVPRQFIPLPQPG
jgi:hypothetical protein